MVLFVTLQLGGEAGVFKSALDVLSALLKHDAPVTVISGRGDKSDQLPPRLNGVDTKKVVFKHLPAKYNLSLLSLFRPVRSVRILFDIVVFSIRRLLLKYLGKPQFVMVNGLGSHDVWSSIEQKNRFPKAIIIRESPRHFQTGKAAHSLAWAVGVLSKYEYHIFVSSNCRDEWSAMEVLQDIPNTYIPNCCEEENASRFLGMGRDEMRRSLNIPSDKFVVMCVGSLQPRKGQDLVVENLDAIVQEIPQALVYFVGSDPIGWQEELKNIVERGGFSDHVRFVPSQPSALEWIYAADVLLLPSRAEAMPRVVLEAMVLKTPVVAAEVDGVSELLEHARTGWLFAHENLEDMVKGLKAATFKDSSSMVARAASKSYWENFSKEKLVDRYCLAFDEIERVLLRRND